MRINSSLGIVGSAQFGISSPYDCHVYALRGPEGVLLIDAGSGLGETEIMQTLANDFPGVPVAAILLTHSHADHSGGAASLQRRCQCPVIASVLTASIVQTADEERSGLKRARAMGGYPHDLTMQPCPVEKSYSDGENFTAAGISFTAVHVRGHSHDSFCLFTEVEGRRACFSADVVFYGGVLGVINAADSNLQDYCKDLPRLQNQGVELLLPGHGLFTLRNGQWHIDAALQEMNSGFLPRQIGQGGGIF
jgi:glyoxylase-like metal-dependent hydrolase (beta-lactamase superfamily II)